MSRNIHQPTTAMFSQAPCCKLQQWLLSDYVLADVVSVINVTDHLSLGQASTLGMGVSTAAQALYLSAASSAVD